MASSKSDYCNKFIIDSIHGDIHLKEREWQVIDTASFQRLRQIKQLQMSHVTYPNATHTRFVHSLGTLRIMQRVLAVTRENGIKLSEEDSENLRLASLLHDVGHYPYSHLLEGVDKVTLLEDRIRTDTQQKRTLDLEQEPRPYPSHEFVGARIVTKQDDLVAAIGGLERAKRIAGLFLREETESKELGKLISSSLDLDRFDYLQRDSQATGVPYGKIDLNYLLNSLRSNASGEIGVHERAIPAVEHFLLARYFMHRTVYYHRTTCAVEEACRQLLKRLRGRAEYDIPADGDEVMSIAESDRLLAFTDSYIDAIIRQATSDNDDVIKSLARSIQTRNPPKLLKEVQVLTKDDDGHPGVIFKMRCRSDIANVARQYGIPIGRFLFCELKPITIEKSVSRFTASEYESAGSDDVKKSLREENEIVKVFVEGEDSPISLLEIKYSLIQKLAGHVFRAYRLYYVPGDEQASPVESLKDIMKDWDKAD